jgi:RNA polymerase sigma-70 factor (TIGR02957 family)
MEQKKTPATAEDEGFDDLRPLLFSIAYRMLGSVKDAEDVVQEAYLRLHRSAAQGTVVESPRAFLATVTTRLAIDQLRSARAQRETYFGPWLPEPLLTSNEPDPAGLAEMADSLSMSFLVLLETLSPVERAVFLLREVFDYGYDEIAGIVDKSEANCRQIFVRARKHIDEGKPRFEATRQQQEELATRFLDAVDNGELTRLVDYLAADVVFYGDGGGKGRGLRKPVFGRDRVGRLLQNFFEAYETIGARVQRVQLNGQPGLFAFDAEGKLINVFSFDIADGVIQTFRSIINPDKLAHLGYPLSHVGRRERHDS